MSPTFEPAIAADLVHLVFQLGHETLVGVGGYCNAQ